MNKWRKVTNISTKCRCLQLATKNTFNSVKMTYYSVSSNSLWLFLSFFQSFLFIKKVIHCSCSLWFNHVEEESNYSEESWRVNIWLLKNSSKQKTQNPLQVCTFATTFPIPKFVANSLLGWLLLCHNIALFYLQVS